LFRIRFENWSPTTHQNLSLTPSFTLLSRYVESWKIFQQIFTHFMCIVEGRLKYLWVLHERKLHDGCAVASVGSTYACSTLNFPRYAFLSDLAHSLVLFLILPYIHNDIIHHLICADLAIRIVKRIITAKAQRRMGEWVDDRNKPFFTIQRRP
jgi:hypothetical protein